MRNCSHAVTTCKPSQADSTYSGGDHFIGRVWSPAHIQSQCDLGQHSRDFLRGVYLAYGYLRTKQLWLSIGLHIIGWNFFEGVVFGFPGSGLDIYALTRIKVHGPEIWTGGAFGPEAGLIVLPSLILGAFLIYRYTKRRTN